MLNGGIRMSSNISAVIADDNREFAEITEDYLSYRDIDVVGIASDGLEAIEKTLKYTPDILILDMILSRVDGLEVIKKIKHNYGLKSVKIIVVSTCRTQKFIDTALDMGADFFYKKPIDLDELVKVCHELGKNEENSAIGFDIDYLYTKKKVEYMRVQKMVNKTLSEAFSFHDNLVDSELCYNLLYHAVCANIYDKETLNLLSSIDTLLTENVIDIRINNLVKDFLRNLYEYFKEFFGFAKEVTDDSPVDFIEERIKDAAKQLLRDEKEAVEKFTEIEFDTKCKYNYLKLIYKLSGRIMTSQN